MNSEFYVHLDAPNNKSLIHLADCQHCNHGEGRTSFKSPYNGEWVGRFDQPTTRLRSRQSDKHRIRWCAFCADSLGISCADA